MFTPSKMLRNYLNAQPRDMFDIVGALMGYINADPQFTTDDFEQAIQYVLNNGVSENELFAHFDESIEFESDSSKWNEEYYSFARVYLKDNFCRKRIEHITAVARKLYPSASVTPKAVNRQPERVTAQTGGTQSPGKKFNRQQPQQIQKRTSVVKGIVAVVIIVLLAVMIEKII